MGNLIHQTFLELPAVMRVDKRSPMLQVTVKEVEQVKRQGEFLGRHITKFKEIVRDLNMPPPTPADGGVAPRPRPALTGY